MSYGDNQYQPMQSAWGDVAARAEPDARAAFIKKTYLHLTGAVLAFCASGICLLECRPIRPNLGPNDDGQRSRCAGSL